MGCLLLLYHVQYSTVVQITGGGGVVVVFVVGETLGQQSCTAPSPAKMHVCTKPTARLDGRSQP